MGSTFTLIYYTNQEGGVWIPEKVALSIEQIKGIIQEKLVEGNTVEFYGLRLHSVLLPDDSRWDARNCSWHHESGLYQQVFRCMNNAALA